jgi:hypothetical protein
LTSLRSALCGILSALLSRVRGYGKAGGPLAPGFVVGLCGGGLLASEPSAGHVIPDWKESSDGGGRIPRWIVARSISTEPDPKIGLCSLFLLPENTGNPPSSSNSSNEP